MNLAAPYPWFGGKRRAAPIVWERFGKVQNYVEPFFGSGAVLLARKTPFGGVETINDFDGLVANFWRAVKADPDAVADHADWPVNENDLHARHAWLVGQKEQLQANMEGDPDFFDAKIAGWWVWGMACWIGSGFCSGHGPWQVVEKDGSRQLVHLGNAGQGVNRKLVHLGDAGRGVNRKRVHLGDAGRGVNRKRENHRECLFAYMRELSERFRHVRVCCGDWARVMGETPTEVFTPAAVFLDPPYADTAKRQSDLYRVDCEQVAHAVREWCIANGGNKNLRICLAGYEGEHIMPDDWETVKGVAGGGSGYGGQAKAGYKNAKRERLWFSPHCLRTQGTLFDSPESAQ